MTNPVDAGRALRIVAGLMIRPFPYIFLAASLLAGCGDLRDETDTRISKETAAELRHDAAILYKEYFAGRGSEIHVINQKYWPQSFARLEPLRVGGYLDGFTLVLSTDRGAEAGLHVVPQDMEVKPTPAPKAHYEQLQPGVYWYRFEL